MARQIASNEAAHGGADGACALPTWSGYHPPMAVHDIYIDSGSGVVDAGFLMIASAYLVQRQRVLLVHHSRFDCWVPPGGHLEPGETFSQAACREAHEETGITVRACRDTPAIHPDDPGAIAEPLPFYVDVETTGFRKPAIVQFFFVAPRASLVV
ncbi:NUDIX domain-containing protein [Miltoncostaea oceani]|uniref:NUDIX domain-containing protein n=1 Tax=Miltoncostaea oceani TaxID=2843216 RepID=UPI001C3DD31B|nr:NUDIX domain-containing protein [Miltoncostaea oceani]